VPYPPDLKAAGISGSVVAQFVVDPNGRADIRSFKVLSAGNPAFVAAVKAALPSWQFEPASVRGHPVRQLIQQEFSFGTLSSLHADK
jgi:TonB family protein